MEEYLTYITNIVDDMEANLVALEAVLGSLDQNLVTVRSGEEALKEMLRQEFAVVLLDVSMPGMDGFETAANIKRLDQTKDVPIILLTGADAESDYVYRGYAVGAADFLTKPIDPWLLRTKVNIFLELHRKNRQLAAQAEQMRRLRRLARAVVWANPHAGHDGYQPVQSGIVAALPHVDQLVAGHSLRSLEEIWSWVRRLSRSGEQLPVGVA